MSRHRLPSLLVLVSACIITLGCAANSPVTPPSAPTADGQALSPAAGNHARHGWGIWEVRIDLVEGTIEAVPLRGADLHFNVVPLLAEGTPYCLLGFSNLFVDSSNHRLHVDISLTHPFATMQQVPGFDVHGTLFTKGSGYHLIAGNVTMTGPDEPRLANADGYTRWWNPQEFPGPSLLGYVDGHYGSPHNLVGYQVTLAGYKYFADSLLALDSMNSLDANDRGVFRAGSRNTRRYLIDFGAAPGNYLVFNYAVDACWDRLPGWNPGDAPPSVPDDFPLTANCPEPYRIRVTESMNSLSATSVVGTSGTVTLNIDVFDWQAMDPLSTVPIEVSVVQVETPQFGLGPITAAVVPGSGAGGHMSTYTAGITGGCPEKLDHLDLIISATSSEGDYQNDITHFQGSGPLQAFFLHRAEVADADVYSGWTYRYSRLLYPEYPNQGDNPPDIAVYKRHGDVRAAMVDQINPDPNGEGGHAPDSINEWADDYTSYSLPEHYHLPRDPLSITGKWDDINGICVSDTSTRFFFSNTNIFDEFTSPDKDPLFCYFTWVTHTYLGNAPADAWFSVFFSNDPSPRYWCTDPSNGVTLATDYIYSVFLYDVTGMGGGDPGADPQRYIIFRWKPPYDTSDESADWQRALNVPPNGVGTGFVDRNRPYDHRLAVDDSTVRDRVYMLDSNHEIEVVDCDFTADEFSGSWPVGTVTLDNLPASLTQIVDIEVVPTKNLGTTRNHVAALCRSDTGGWRVWVFDFDDTQDVGSQGVTQWISGDYEGMPCSLDAADNPIEVHVLHQNGRMTYVSVFRDYP